MFNCKNCVHTKVCNLKEKYEIRCRDLEAMTKGWEFKASLECPNHLAKFELNSPSPSSVEVLAMPCLSELDVPNFRHNINISNLNVSSKEDDLETMIKNIKKSIIVNNKSSISM